MSHSLIGVTYTALGRKSRKVIGETKMKSFLDQKARIAFIFATLALMLLGMTAYRWVADGDDSIRRVLLTQQVLAGVQNLDLDIKSLYSNSGAFALTGEDRFIESHNASLKNIEEDEAAILGLTVDDPALNLRLPAIDALATENIKNAESMLTLRKQNGSAPVLAAGIRASQQSVDEFDAAVGKFRIEELRLLKLHTATAEWKLSQVKLVLIIGTILGIFIAGAAAWDAQHEISEHARTATALGESKEELRLLLDEFQDYAIFTLDRKGQVVSWNAGAERVKGYTAPEIIGQNFSRFFPQRDVAHHKPDEILRMTAVFGRFEELGDRVRKDGSEFMAAVTDIALRDAAGSLRGFSVISHDLTSIHESEARYRGLLEAAPDGMVVVNETGEIILLNARAEKQFGYRRDELLGQKVTNIIPNGFAERLIADGTRTAAELLAQHIGMGIELQGRCKDGAEFPIEIMLSPLESTDGILLTAAIRDITIRKDAERQLAQMEARYRGLLEAAPDGMVVVDQSGKITLLNAQAEKQFGYRRSDLIGKNVTNIIPEGFAERLISDALRTKAEALAQQIGTGIELVGRRKDGTTFPIEIMLSPLESAEGVLVTAAIRDISERKQLARQLHQSQKMEAVGQLTGGIAHDFNNLLTVIIGNLGLLEILASDNEAATKRIRTAQKAATRGADITRRLLVFSRNEELKPAFVLLGDSIQNMIEMASRALGSEIKITTQLDHTVPPLFVDTAALESALLNLVVNARDAMPKGGSIIVSSALQNLDNNHPAVQAGELKEGSYVCVGVTDTGQGMSPETIERACEPFFTTKRHNKGTGLGLAMVYGFVKQSGGVVRIYSELEHGTTVSFYLPIVADLLYPALADTPKSFNATLSGTVLVVDDEADLLEVALIYLEEMGFTVFQAKDGAGAIKTIALHTEIDLMITDIVMPGGMNGPELVRRARALRPALKIIYSSGFPAEALAERATPLAEGPLLRKPYQRSEFSAMVRSVMEASDDTRAELETAHSG